MFSPLARQQYYYQCTQVLQFRLNDVAASETLWKMTASGLDNRMNMALYTMEGRTEESLPVGSS